MRPTASECAGGQLPNGMVSGSWYFHGHVAIFADWAWAYVVQET